jgi:GTPase
MIQHSVTLDRHSNVCPPACLLTALQVVQEEGIEIVDVEDVNWKEDAQGGAGERRRVTLQLQVVADVGIVGLPNVGKSTLLRRMTRSEAAVANYPFTTLMPNLGVLTTDEFSRDAAQPPVLVDLPGLIEGAHTGRGLGRMFLRHLARTRVVVHVLDASADDPAADYWVVREELRMFNPEYCSRPTFVVLNKMDLPDASELKV